MIGDCVDGGGYSLVIYRLDHGELSSALAILVLECKYSGQG